MRAEPFDFPFMARMFYIRSTACLSAPRKVNVRRQNMYTFKAHTHSRIGSIIHFLIGTATAAFNGIPGGRGFLINRAEEIAIDTRFA
jgi:hypothetical protein